MNFPIKIHIFVVESQNFTNNSLIFEDEIKGRNFLTKRCDKQTFWFL